MLEACIEHKTNYSRKCKSCLDVIEFNRVYKLKRCRGCKEIKPLRDFPESKDHHGGYHSHCQICKKQKERLWRIKNKDFLNKRRKQYNIDHPNKQNARNVFRNAVQRKELLRPNRCSTCGIVGKIDGHHEDYNKPLEIVWLCKRCHRLRHVELRK